MTAYGHPVVIVTGDKDMSQLVSEWVNVFDLRRDNGSMKPLYAQSSACRRSRFPIFSRCTAIISTTFRVLWAWEKKPRNRFCRYGRNRSDATDVVLDLKFRSL